VKNPYDNLQVSIPNMERFQEASINGTEIKTTWIAEYIAGVYKYGIGVIGIVAMMAIAIGGAMWIISAGNPGRISEAKAWITNGLIGLALGLGSYVMLGMLNYDLIKFRSITVYGIRDPKPDSGSFSSSGGTLTGVYTGKPSFTNNVATYDSMLQAAASTYGVDCTLLKAIMMAESNGNPKATSALQAKGLMQIMPGTFKSLNVGTDPYDPQTSINGGAKYLAQLQAGACNGKSSSNVCNVSNLKYVIAAYNGGPGANKESVTCPGKTLWECPANHTSDPNSYRQTYNYVGKVTANINYLKQKGWGC